MNNEIIVGKYTLESLTNGMYASAKDLFREYIQNAVDSIDNAVYMGVLQDGDGIIEITSDADKKYICINDNGQGIPSSKAAKLLLDIGNSSKNRQRNRGFRGIGRLAGLGYCDQLVFTTSAINEKKKTVITFDALKLKGLLRSTNDKNESITDVIDAVVNVEYAFEKEKAHYFSVEMIGVDKTAGIQEKNDLIEYFVQYLPLKFSPEFKWGDLITKKIKKIGYSIPSYKVIFSDGKEKMELYKAYSDSFISDRVKKYEKAIQDIEIKPYFYMENLVAIMWYAKTDYSGTVLDELVKGIRMRQGNILIGNKTTSNQFFREDRFNGWLIGELYIINSCFVPNARRDDFENTAEYIWLKELLLSWGTDISKEIRHISYERNVEESKKKAMEAADENNLVFEDLSFIGEEDEISDEVDEASVVASNELLDRFKILLGQKSVGSKYLALNLRIDIPVDQKKILEKVFTTIEGEFSTEDAEKIIETIIKAY